MKSPSKTKLNRKLNSLLTVEKILSDQQDQARFIEILENEADGFMARAARVFGCSVRTVQRRMVDYPVFNEAVKTIQQAYRQKRLDTLETISYDAAKQPENFKERKFLMESLNPRRYRSNVRDIGPANIQINFGYTMPEKRYGMDEDVQDVEIVEEVESPDHGITDLDVEDI
tara:strand:+ start:396 stop:911 length:516 start_codon:yes stop_codon:yes gene_type:complete